jgi:hypothetical protein
VRQRSSEYINEKHHCVDTYTIEKTKRIHLMNEVYTQSNASLVNLSDACGAGVKIRSCKHSVIR